LGGLEAIKFIRDGGFVSLAGDLVWTDPRSRLTVKIFGREADLPAASSSGAGIRCPVFTLFSFRVKRGKYQILISPPRMVKASSRSERSRVIQESANRTQMPSKRSRASTRFSGIFLNLFSIPCRWKRKNPVPTLHHRIGPKM